MMSDDDDDEAECGSKNAFGHRITAALAASVYPRELVDACVAVCVVWVVLVLVRTLLARVSSSISCNRWLLRRCFSNLLPVLALLWTTPAHLIVYQMDSNSRYTTLVSSSTASYHQQPFSWTSCGATSPEPSSSIGLEILIQATPATQVSKVPPTRHATACVLHVLAHRASVFRPLESWSVFVCLVSFPND